MVRKYKRKTAELIDDTLRRAVQAVQLGMSVRQAAIQFNVNRSTLGRQVDNNRNSEFGNSESDLSNMLHSIRPFPSNTVPPTTGKRRGRKPGKPEILTSDESMTVIAAAEEKKNSKLAKVKQGKVAKPTK